MISLVIVNIAALIVDDFVGRLIYKAVNVKEYKFPSVFILDQIT